MQINGVPGTMPGCARKFLKKIKKKKKKNIFLAIIM